MRGAGLRVLVTRPDGGATAARLRAMGHRPILLPLSRVEALPPLRTLDLFGIRAVAATSANALRLADRALLDALKRKPLFAVGQATARASQDAGFADIRVGSGDAHGLARLLLASSNVSPLLYLCGRIRRSDFEAALSANGIAVLAVETYDTLPLEPSPEALDAATTGVPIDAVLLFSVMSAEIFRRLRNSPLLAEAAVLALSPRIAEAAGGGHAAAEPNEDALLALFDAASFHPPPVW